MRNRIVGVLLGVAVAAGGCSDGQMPMATAPSPAANLAGTWQGTVSVFDVEEERWFCTGSAAAELNQDGASVTGVLTGDATPCSNLNHLGIDAEWTGARLVGLIKPSEWTVYGSVDGSSLTLTTLNVKWQLHRTP